MDYIRAEDVAAPLERIWQLLIDVEGWPRWTESMRRITRLDQGPLQVGSRSRVVQPRGRPMVWTVTELEPLQSFTWATHAPGLRLVGEHRLETAGDMVHTRLRLTTEGPLAGLASLTAGARIRSYVDMESAGLKRASEQPSG